MAENRGKKFENVIKQSFLKVPDVSVDRLHDQTNGFKGSTNICDFIVYKKPHEYYIECKSIHGNTFSIHSVPKPDKNGTLHGFYGNITDTQWEGLVEKSKIEGVFAGVIVWWVDKDVTVFFPIEILQEMKRLDWKSIRFDSIQTYFMPECFVFSGKKKRVFFEYDMQQFFDEMERRML